ALGVQLTVAAETRYGEVAVARMVGGGGVPLVPRSILGVARRGAWVSRPLRGSHVAREIYVVHRRRPPEPVPAMVAILRRTAREASTHHRDDLSEPVNLG